MLTDELEYVIETIYDTLFETVGPLESYYDTIREHFYCQSALLWTADELANRVSMSYNSIYNEEEIISRFIEEMEEYINIAKNDKIRRIFTIAYEFASDILWRLTE